MSHEVNDNTDRKRFELEVDGHIAFANYRIDGDYLYINYVEAPEILRGTGAAGKLMEGMMQIARERNYRITPICSYAVSWLRRHQEYQDLLA